MNARFFVQKQSSFAAVRQQQLRHELAVLYPQHSALAPEFDRLISHADHWVIYDIFNAEASQIEALRDQILSDAATDIIHQAPPETGLYFTVELLPGQFDARSAAAEQSLGLLIDGEIPADLIITTGELWHFDSNDRTNNHDTTEAISLIKRSLINPVESRGKDLSVLLPPTLSAPGNVPIYEGFRTLTDTELQTFIADHALAMSLADLHCIQAYFQQENRDPTETELKVLDTYWSDHCRHTTFFTTIDDAVITDKTPAPLAASWQRYLDLRAEVSNKSICLMEMGTIAAKTLKKRGVLTSLENSEEDNACSVIIDVPGKAGSSEPWLLMFKNETHNHPTEIDPFGGAATCIGGAIRDPLSGRAYVYQAMRLTGAGYQSADTPTLPGKLPQSKICRDAAHGYSSYGNQIGLATTLVRELYHPNYVAKRMEVGVVVGGVKQSEVRRESPAPGDIIIMLGGKTGRDGIGGATGSSKTQTQDSVSTLSAEVQKGNATEERKIQRLFRNPDFLALIKKSNDFGAGGVSVAIGELADSLEVDLDVIPTKYAGLNGTELAISESQERMAVVIEAKDKAAALQMAAAENLLACQVATVTDSGYLRLHWQGKTIVNLSREFLNTNGAQRQTTAHLESHAPSLTDALPETPAFSQDTWQEALQSLSRGSQQALAESFDASIGTTTVLNPYGGVHKLSPEQVSAQTFMHNRRLTTLASFGFSPDLAMQSPYLAGQFAVTEAVAKVVVAGANLDQIWLSFQEYFGRLGDDPARWGIPMASLLGALDAQLGLGYAAIGGKDSMSGTYQDIDVPPTLIAFAVGVADTAQVVSATLVDDTLLYYLPCPLTDDQTSVDFEQYQQQLFALAALIQDDSIAAARVISDDGIAVSLSQMAMGNQVGFTVSDTAGDLSIDWLSPQYGGILLAAHDVITGEQLPGIRELGKTHSVDDNNNNPIARIHGVELSLAQIIADNTQPLTALYPPPAELTETPIPDCHNPTMVSATAPSVLTATPQVVLPIFPGTNCEYDTQAAFERAGAAVQPILIRNLDHDALASSAAAVKAALDDGHILMLSGGFSLADEPDGAGKFIANFLRIPAISDAIHGLLAREGLVLGICNGFQALIKSGLLPYGEVTTRQANDPTLTYNTIGRHIARVANIRLTNNHSPWLSGDAVGETFDIPLSHGEGRLIATAEQLQAWQKHGQIATQYVDDHQQPTLAYPANPNGSVYAIEGLTSRCGKIYGRMAHPERMIGAYPDSPLLQNIPDIRTHDIFSNGVRYFTGKNPAGDQ